VQVLEEGGPKLWATLMDELPTIKKKRRLAEQTVASLSAQSLD
jgi:hypothetical protein